MEFRIASASETTRTRSEGSLSILGSFLVGLSAREHERDREVTEHRIHGETRESIPLRPETYVAEPGAADKEIPRTLRVEQ